MQLPSPPIKDLSWRVHLTMLDFVVLLTGLVFSPPLLSIGLIGICVVGILDFPRGINPAWTKGIRDGIRDPFNWAFATLYLILLFGCWQTEDWDYYGERLRIKSALIAVPIGWWGLPKLGRTQWSFIVAFLVAMMSVVAIGVLANYALHFTDIQQALLEGRALPVPRNHIRFSLLVALTTVASLGLAQRSAFGYRKLWLFAALFLFAFQHVLAVRSGLFCAYAGLFGFLFAFGRKWGSRRVLLFGVGVLVLLPLLAYLSLPSLKAKVDYAKYELWRSAQGLDTKDYSDAGRLSSIRLGFELWREHPILGVGPGNLRMEMDRLYAEKLPAAEAKRPHNQYVSVLAGSGLLGLAVFLFSIVHLIFGRSRWKDPSFLGVCLIVFTSCLVENTLENSAGIGLFSFFLFFFRPEEGYE